MNIKPLRNSIFVLPDKIVDKTNSGIILTDFTKKRPTSGTIIAIGKGVEEDKFEVLKTFKIGQRVIYGEFSGAKHTINYNNEDTEIFIMTPDDILALLQ